VSATDIHAPIDAVVFDIGGVLLDWDPRHLYRKLFADEAEMEYFLSAICTLEWHHDNDLGVPLEATCGRLADAHPDYAEMIWAWGRRSEEMIAGPIEGTVAVLDALHEAGVRCYALTNMESWTFPVRRARFPFFAHFDGIVVSSHEGVAKPDPEIFRRLLERFGLVASRTLLIDDALRNVEAARAAGMQAIRFSTPEQLRTGLEHVGLLAAG
jgi:HAD superfamily hydrolase (TIGR01509 family)